VAKIAMNTDVQEIPISVLKSYCIITKTDKNMRCFANCFLIQKAYVSLGPPQ
jgi:hypothetical protein